MTHDPYAYKDCRHLTVMPDPILGDWCCTRCLKPFRQIPDVDNDVPRISTFWQRIKWAFKPRKKVNVIPFVWSVSWAKERDTQGRPPMQPHWSNKPTLIANWREKAKRVYTHPASASNLLRLPPGKRPRL